CPPTSPCQVSSAVNPSGVTAPRPVTTTRRRPSRAAESFQPQDGQKFASRGALVPQCGQSKVTSSMLRDPPTPSGQDRTTRSCSYAEALNIDVIPNRSEGSPSSSPGW